MKERLDIIKFMLVVYVLPILMVLYVIFFGYPF